MSLDIRNKLCSIPPNLLNCIEALVPGATVLGDRAFRRLFRLNEVIRIGESMIELVAL